MTRRNASVMKVGVTCTYQEVLVRASNNTKAVVPLSYQRINFNIVYIAIWSLVTIMHNCGIQLHGTVK